MVGVTDRQASLTGASWRFTLPKPIQARNARVKLLSIRRAGEPNRVIQTPVPARSPSQEHVLSSSLVS
jgi:hypothetical protein